MSAQNVFAILYRYINFTFNVCLISTLSTFMLDFSWSVMKRESKFSKQAFF